MLADCPPPPLPRLSPPIELLSLFILFGTFVRSCFLSPRVGDKTDL
jgi:hypothetical protein